MGQVQDKVALITGGASGIGAACARTLAREGAKVAITDIDDDRGAALAESIGGLYLHLDVTDEAAWPGAVAAVEKKFGRLDILVANAGIAIFCPVVDMSLADWRRQNAVNIDGVFLSAKHTVLAMRRSGGGSIIIMSSIAGLRGSGNLAGYSTSKGAVRLFSKSLALECAAAGDNIRVNSVHPGIILTAIWRKASEQQGVGPKIPLDPHELGRTGVPLGAAAEPEEIANGVLFLASDLSRHVTGSELVIDGGMTAGAVRRTPSS
jgi:NAD(P)-dependent dehydrogenase (short-subunit alcohol dehydrogenase family)